MSDIKDKEGRLFLADGEWILDAEPHVTVLFERLFPGTKHRFVGTDPEFIFTHRPRFIDDSVHVRKDIYWFIKRYNLDISEKDFNYLKDGDAKYDSIMTQSKEAFENYQTIFIENFAHPLRDYQKQACSLALHKRFLLIADQVGLGKTPTGIAIASKNLPALCIVPTHLKTQWKNEILKFMPDAKVHIIQQRETYNVPPSDFYIISYHNISWWIEFFTKTNKIETLVMDEVHSLRRQKTKKYEAAMAIAEVASVKIGLSATPIMNYGIELYNVFQILQKDCLGSSENFSREWCLWGRIRDPLLLGNFLRKNMMMVRRTRADVGLELDQVNRTVYDVDADLKSLQQINEDAKMLAMKVITGAFHESGEAARELEWRMRHATGVAKAKAVAEIVKSIVDSGEKVVLFGWHRDVYYIWLHELKAYNPVMYTGSESSVQKEVSLREFIEGDAKVFIMSLRSGAGVNGLQLVSSYAVFGELDWSPGVMNQCIGRLWRDGQENQVNAVFVTVQDGADPFMKKVIGEKTVESKKIIDPTAQVLSETTGANNLKNMAQEWLRAQGVDVDSIMKERQQELEGQKLVTIEDQDERTKQVYQLLNENIRYFSNELELQEHIESILKKHNIPYQREFIISEKSRVDFKVYEDVFIECKVKGFNKRDMLRQVRRYKYEYKQTRSMIIVTPEPFRHFNIDEVPVFALNTSNSSLMMEGLS